MQTIYLIRGAPGSGKTTCAQLLISEGIAQKHFEADSFFINQYNEYTYNREFNEDAHNLCFLSAKQALYAGYSVVVSNTFTKLWELESYFKMAQELNVQVKVFHCNRSYKNVHNVPQSVVDRMKQTFEKYPDEETI